VIDEVKIHEEGGVFDLAGDPEVGFAGVGITGGMIVDEDESVGVAEDDGFKDIGDVEHGLVKAAVGEFLDANEVQLGIENNKAEGFVIEGAKFVLEVLVNGAGIVKGFGGELFAGDAAAEFEGGGELHGFGGADAFDFCEFTGTGAGDAGEGTESDEEIGGELENVGAFDAGAQENGDKLGIGNAGGTDAKQSFAREFFLGHFFQSRHGKWILPGLWK